MPRKTPVFSMQVLLQPYDRYIHLHWDPNHLHPQPNYLKSQPHPQYVSSHSPILQRAKATVSDATPSPHAPWCKPEPSSRSYITTQVCEALSARKSHSRSSRHLATNRGRSGTVTLFNLSLPQMTESLWFYPWW